MDLLLAALGAFFVVEFLKTLLGLADQVMHGWLKLLVAYAVAALLAGMLVGWEDGLTLAVAAAGLAALVQKVHRLVSLLGDSQQVAVVAKATQRRF